MLPGKLASEIAPRYHRNSRMSEKQHQPVVSRLLEAGRLLNRKMAESGECSPVCGGKGWVEKMTVIMLDCVARGKRRVLENGLFVVSFILIENGGFLLRSCVRMKIDMV